MLRSPLRAYRVSGRTGAQLAPLPGYRSTRSTRDLAIPGAHNHRGGLKETAARGFGESGRPGSNRRRPAWESFGSASKTRAVLGIVRLPSVPRAPDALLCPDVLPLESSCLTAWCRCFGGRLRVA